KNQLANESEMFIYSDAPKDDAIVVQEVQNYIRTIDGFKKVIIIERETHQGLADNIIDGVTKIVNKYGRVIVLEDDLVTSPFFLRFMNDALDFYQNEEKVMHISGYTSPISTDKLPETVFTRVTGCWGWATWAEKWQYFERNISYLDSKFTRKMKCQFNRMSGNFFWRQIEQNKSGKINTWFIFWYASVFLKGGLCLCPRDSMVQNIGFDGSGVHCGVRTNYLSQPLADKPVEFFETNLQESMEFFQREKIFRKSQKPSLLKRIINKLLKMIRK
ncbi:MAG: sugar transferase, partial [Candidatus Electrothrix sp. MAN1_4]|nr:sugar transferase [Candidatus Electrothrix sp. MAN1_4]